MQVEWGGTSLAIWEVTFARRKRRQGPGEAHGMSEQMQLLLQLGFTCCLAKGDLHVQHFKEVRPVSLDVLSHSLVGDSCVPCSLKQQTPWELFTSPNDTEMKRGLSRKENFQTGGIKGSSVFIHKSDYNSRRLGEGRQCLEFETKCKGII